MCLQNIVLMRVTVTTVTINNYIPTPVKSNYDGYTSKRPHPSVPGPTLTPHASRHIFGTRAHLTHTCCFLETSPFIHWIPLRTFTSRSYFRFCVENTHTHTHRDGCMAHACMHAQAGPSIRGGGLTSKRNPGLSGRATNNRAADIDGKVHSMM